MENEIMGRLVKDFDSFLKNLIKSKGVNVEDEKEIKKRVKWISFKNDNYIYIDDELSINWDSTNVIETNYTNGRVSYNLYVKE